MKTTTWFVTSTQKTPIYHDLMIAIRESRTLEEFEARWNDAWGLCINDELAYAGKQDSNYSYRYFIENERPIYYAVTLNKPFLVEFLKNQGAVEQNERYLLSHALTHLDLEGVKKVRASDFTWVYLKGLLTEDSRKFDYVHQHLFRDRTLAQVIQDQNASSAMNNEYYQAITRRDWYRKNLKPKYLSFINGNNDLKSALKIQWLLGIDNPVIRFLKTSKKNNEIKNTASYKKLVTMLKGHKFSPGDFDALRDQLMVNIDTPAAFTPNPVAAALYFAYRSANDDGDYRILERHLMITPITGYTPAQSDLLNNFLSHDGLTDNVLKRLKTNVMTIIQFNESTYTDLKETLTATTNSPLKTIVRRGQSSRLDKETYTFCLLGDLGFFKRADQSPQSPPAYTTEYQEVSKFIQS